MTEPLVPICLPNLNTRPFLPERVRTILRQTYGNWELIVSDNYSEDGGGTSFGRSRGPNRGSRLRRRRAKECTRTGIGA
jgi:hypothetical protein